MKPQLKFHGTLAEFKQFMTDLGLTGEWREIANNGHHFREESGASVSWWPQSGTCWVDGNEPMRSTVRRQIADALQSRTPDQRATGAQVGNSDFANAAESEKRDTRSAEPGLDDERKDDWNRFKIQTAGGHVIYGHFKIKPGR